MKRFVPVLVLLIMASAGTSLAATVTVTWLNQYDASYQATVSLRNTSVNSTPDVTWSEGNVILPPYGVNISGAAESWLNGIKSVFCLDLVSGVGTDGNYELIKLGTTAIDLTLGKTGGGTAPVSLTGFRLKGVKSLLANNYQTLTKVGNSYYSNDTAAELSLALWEMIYQTALPNDVAFFDGGGNGFRVSNISKNSDSIVSKANLMLTAALVDAKDYDNVYLLRDTSYQDFAFAVLGNQSFTVPEPMAFVRFATLGLLGLPIGAIALYRRRRRA